MELIHHNPFRIAGILSNASTKEIEKQKSKIKAFARVGKEINSDLDFFSLENVQRTEDILNKAFSNIEQNQDKVNHSLFWFLNASPFDNIALDYLKNNDEEKALETWEKITLGKDVNSKNFSAFNNLGTYKLLSNQRSEIKEGIEAKIKLIESDYFEDFVHLVADETYSIDHQRQSEKIIDDLLAHFKNQYSSSETLKLFDSCNETTQKYLSKRFTEEPIHNIEGQIESCKKKRKVNKGNSYEFGLKLYSNTKEDLSLLKSLLGTNDLKYKAIADQLANEIMQCGIDYFNESQSSNSSINYLESAQKLTKLADSVAVGKLAKDRVKDSLATLEDMKDQEINEAILALQSVKDAYERNKSEINAQVRSMPLGYNQTINWTKVNAMIEESIDWNKVVELIKKVIPLSSVEKIKASQKTSKINNYKTLVEFIFSKLSRFQINEVKYICYWKDVSPILTSTKNVASKKAKDGCYIATMAYGDYDHPQVMELRKFRDDFLRKSLLGRSFIDLYYKYSPSLVERLKNKKYINSLVRNVLDQFIKVIK